MARQAGIFELHLPLDDRAPLQRQVYAGLRGAILDGRLAPGARLPASRRLAEQLAVSRTTVATAYDQLTAEGFVAARERSGVFVADTLALGRPAPAARAAPLPAPTAAASPVSIPFQTGAPEMSDVPWRRWARLVADRIVAAPLIERGYGDLLGHPDLRRAIADHVRAARGVACGPDQVVVTAGAQGAFFLIAHALVPRGARAWMEDPGYFGAKQAFRAAGLDLVPVPVDGCGLRVDEGVRRAPDAALAYVTPSHQYPTGAVLGARRRMDLLAWAGAAQSGGGAWIVEDDYDAEYRHHGAPLGSLQGLAAQTGTGARVLYVGTFAKTLFPAMRIGYVVAPSVEVAERLAAARAMIDRGPPTHDQGALADFIESGLYARRLRRVRRLYASRRAALLAAFTRHGLDGRFEISGAAAGLHLTALLPPGEPAAPIAARCAELGVSVATLASSALEPLGRDGLVLGYGAFDEAAIEAAVARLARAAGKGEGGRDGSARLRR